MKIVTKSYFHSGGTEALLGATIPEHFEKVVSRFPEHEAVVSLPQSKRLTYQELSNEVDNLARGLVGIGFGKGDRIGVWSTDNLEWLLLQIATARIGAVLVNINPAYRTRELAYALDRSEVQGLFSIPSFRSSDYVAMLLELLPELQQQHSGDLQSEAFPFLRHVVLYDPAKPDTTERSHPGFLIWPEVMQAGTEVDIDAVEAITASLDRDDAINIQYTSGTTGFPKAVVLSHHNILNNAYFSARAMHFSENDRLCIPVTY